MKTLVFDTGPIISLTMNNLLWLLEALKEESKGRFLITQEVKEELVDNPLNHTKRFMFEAMQVLDIIENGVLEVVRSPAQVTNELLDLANSCFSTQNHNMRLVHPAEISALALAMEIDANAYVVDERTTRLMVEDPHKLLNVLKHMYRFRIDSDKSLISRFQKLTKGVRIIRSVELVTIAYEKGLLDKYVASIPDARKRLLESVIWGVKLEGCAVSKKELEQIQRIEMKR